MDLDALVLSRLQFAWVIAWHILLPAFTVGLACYIATLEVLWWITQREVYLRLSAFWIKLFAVSFGMGVVSGIVMPFQFGTNWSRFADATFNVVGALMAYEVLTAFFLEAAFLGILLFGRRLVPQWAHVVSALLVALGTLLSSFWILGVNSWMQTPRGHELVDGRFMPQDMLAVLFTPSFPYRLTHNVFAFLITTGFVVLAVGAGYLRRGRHVEESRVMVKMSLGFLSVMVPLQIVAGDLHGLNTLEHQPAKVAAMEGLWETQRRVPASLFAIPDAEAETNHFEIAIPALGSLYLTHDLDGEVKGLKEWPREDRPPVAIVYFAFRVMVGIGVLMLGIVVAGWVQHWRGRLMQPGRFLRVAEWSGPLGFVAVLAGWTVTEVGRQPWVVYGLMRTRDAVSPTLTAGDVSLSLAAYMLSYLVIFGGGFMLLRRLVLIGPQPATGAEVHETEARPKRPLSAVTDTPATARRVEEAGDAA
ncbi:cytochrome ubiquinol oxidase subunit I [Aquabacterium sp. A7-Y]|uniref:cytochrome ubiquinol oxidase subunit I n=1 Tax=Aquabacterium sp. A7-Y TaxID=1349605 RepID=UPI00223D9389|nr:cytochrome ubiquinol oxidase subunit I [Aquabacterium sp. A7-Y]MCW7539408.1 cytochrome ubiquinol oxidase subunit I [Aquabacterium sp. A7-Y]